jgi:hypothetical protein
MLFLALLIITLVMIIMIFSHYVDFLLLGYGRYRREGGNLLVVVFVIVLKLMLPIAVIAGLMMWSIQPKPSQEKTITKYDYYRGISGNFILPYDHPYGDFVIPKGSLINRGGDSSSNENEDVVRMSRLFSVRFPYPVKIAGVQVNALSPYSSPFELELAEDAVIGPVYDRQGKKLADEQSCKQGDIAEYYQPRLKHGLYLLDYVMGESLRDLYFAPDHWLFLGCESDDVIDVPLPYSSKIGDPIMKGEQ